MRHRVKILVDANATPLTVTFNEGELGGDRFAIVVDHVRERSEAVLRSIPPRSSAGPAAIWWKRRCCLSLGEALQRSFFRDPACCGYQCVWGRFSIGRITRLGERGWLHGAGHRNGPDSLGGL